MVKLTEAKCPNCGANIEVNEKLEKSICQYCGGTVIIQEAIEKYQVELTGKVEVEGIRGRKTKITQARKHMALQEYDQAQKLLLEIIGEDKFDVEAYVELLKIDIERIKGIDFNENSSDLTCPNEWRLIKEIKSYYDRIKKIDDSNISEELLADYVEDINHYLELIKRANEEEKVLNEYTEKLNNYLQQVRNISGPCTEVWMEKILGEHFLCSGLQTQFSAVNSNSGASYNDTYKLVKFTRITRDGILEGKYRNTTKVYTTNTEYLDLHRTDAETVSSIEEITEKINQIEELSEEYIKNSKNYTNEQIDKANKKLDRANTFIDIKNKFKYVIMGALALWIIGFVCATISVFANNGIVMRNHNDNICR